MSDLIDLKYPIYGTPGAHITIGQYERESDSEEALKNCGYFPITLIESGKNNDAVILELWHTKETEESLVEFWAEDGFALFQFYCENKMLELECIERLLNISKNIISWNRNLPIQ